jgi:hypothetical protein
MWASWKKEHEAQSPSALAGADGEMQRLFTVLGDLAQVQLHVDFDGGEIGGVRLQFQLAPATANGPAATAIASMSAIDVGALMSLPKSAPLVAAPGDEDELRSALRDWSGGRVDPGRDAKGALPVSSKRREPRRWKDDPAASFLVARLGHQVNFALLADAARLMTLDPPRTTMVPVLFAYGKETLSIGPATGWIELDVGFPVLLSLSRW